MFEKNIQAVSPDTACFFIIVANVHRFGSAGNYAGR